VWRPGANAVDAEEPRDAYGRLVPSLGILPTFPTCHEAPDADVSPRRQGRFVASSSGNEFGCPGGRVPPNSQPLVPTNQPLSRRRFSYSGPSDSATWQTWPSLTPGAYWLLAIDRTMTTKYTHHPLKSLENSSRSAREYVCCRRSVVVAAALGGPSDWMFLGYLHRVVVSAHSPLGHAVLGSLARCSGIWPAPGWFDLWGEHGHWEEVQCSI